jgi:hypothetical protein
MFRLITPLFVGFIFIWLTLAYWFGQGDYCHERCWVGGSILHEESCFCLASNRPLKAPPRNSFTKGNEINGNDK